jgi:hypothetical protein
MAWAGPAEIRVLEVEKERLRVRQDSSEVRHLQLLQEEESLSARVDSLKRIGEVGEELRQVLCHCTDMVERRNALELELEELRSRREDLDERLRLAYDWEIGALIQKLGVTPDKGLILQLILFQEARANLGDKVDESQLHYSEEMDISPDDGVDDILQKIELMKDIADRLRAEAMRTSQRLLRLEKVLLLQARVHAIGSEIRLVDQQAAEGRMLLTTSQPREEVREAVAPTLVPSGEPQSEHYGRWLGGIRADRTQLEIQKLKARQQELHQLELVVRERARTFRSYMSKLLAGEE